MYQAGFWSPTFHKENSRMNMKGTRESRRYTVENKRRECNLCVITFKDLAWKDHSAMLMDISRYGAGIESDGRIDPGFVWFRDRVGGFKGGVLMWSKEVERRHRAGIRFVPLSRSEEKFIDEQIALVRADKPLKDPVAVITTIMESLTHSSATSSPAASLSREPVGKSADDDDDDIISDLRDIVSSF
jgi:hypothetical protein